MCCEPCGSSKEYFMECPNCGNDVDEDGVALDICAWSNELCEVCGCAPCDDAC